MRNSDNASEMIAQIDAVSGARHEPADHVTPEGDTVTPEAVEAAALNMEPEAEEPFEYDVFAGQTSGRRLQTRQDDSTEERDEDTELRDAIVADQMASPEAAEGVANWNRQLEERRREQQAREGAREMADEIRSYLGRYLVFPAELRDAQLGVMALWALHTWSYRASGVTPYLAFVAPTKGAGKTTAMEVLSTLVPNPSPMGVTPTAPVIRLLASEGRTIFLDEIDTLTKGAAGGDIAAVLNSGYKSGGAVMRVARAKGGSYIEQSSTFTPKCVAGIAPEGELPLPAATQDRCIQLRTTRAKAGELPARFRVDVMRDEPEIVNLRDLMQTWSHLQYRAIRDTRVNMPEMSSSRAEQIWEPLVAIADLLGGHWAEQVRGWAQQLDSQREKSADPNTGFVADIKTVVLQFLEDNPGTRQIPVETLVKMRNDLDGRQVTQSMNTIQSGRRLGAFGIKSTPVAKVRVYKLTDGDNLLPAWKDLFERYTD